jgi:hypothetical protein
MSKRPYRLQAPELEPMRYMVWFVGNRNKTETIIYATTRKEAIADFAASNGVKPSSYIQARKA